MRDKIIYPSIRNAERTLEMIETVKECGMESAVIIFGITASGIRSAMRKISKATVYDLKLVRGDQVVPVGKIAHHDGFYGAVKSAVHHYQGTFRNLELHDWSVTDGKTSILLTDLESH